jgi:hypothetical protein
VDVVEHRQVGDRRHRSALLGEDREHGLAGALRGPPPAGGQGLDDVQAAPVLGVLGRVALDRGIRAGVGDDDHDRAGVIQAQQFEADRRVGVRYRVTDELGGDCLDVSGVVA